MKIKSIILVLVAFLGISIFSSCVNQDFEPPETTCSEVNLKPTHTIKELKAIYQGETIRISENVIIEAYVTSSDKEGNFYKELVIEDESDAIVIQIDANSLYNKFPLGQKIYVKCKGLYLGYSHGVIKLGSTYKEYGIVRFGRIQGPAVIDAHIINSCNNKKLEPTEIKLDEVGFLFTYKLVKISNVQFKKEEIGSTWADAGNFKSVDNHIIDKNKNSLIVRTSGYAAFAGDLLPEGNGEIVGILSKYNSNYQLIIRDPQDAKMNNPRFKEPIIKDFEDMDLTSGGWSNYVVEGASWGIGTIGGTYGKCSNYVDGSNIKTESWFISPELNINNFSAPFLSFKSAWGYSGALIEVKYSTDYDGTSNPNTATWTDLSPTLYSGSEFWTWTESGNLDIPKNTKYIAFVYKGSSSNGRTWEIDDILIDDNI